MAPIKPHWVQPSHPDIQEVIVNDAEFTTKSISKIALKPFGLFAKLEFPPCTVAAEPTYATVQTGRDSHLDLNSDLLYINHSCEPSLIFDTASMTVIAGPKGLQPGDELTFFYPSTEWHMAQPFDCFCGAPTCRGRISGARDMTLEQLSGLWLNRHIRDLLEEREREREKAGQQSSRQNGTSIVAAPPNANGNGIENGNGNGVAVAAAAEKEEEEETDQTEQALREALAQAEKAAEAARLALASYVGGRRRARPNGEARNGHKVNGSSAGFDGPKAVAAVGVPAGSQRRGPTSRELSGEVGGGTSSV